MTRTTTKLGIHPLADGHSEFENLEEGEHYTVLTHSIRGDMHVPSIVSWANGETNHLREDSEHEIVENALESLEMEVVEK